MIVSKTFCTISGASPIDGSSSSRSRGRDIIARPIASICCSPPDKRAGRLAAAFLQAREQREDALDVRLDRRAIGACVGAHREVFLDRQRAEHAAALGHHREAAADELERRVAGDVVAVVADRARLDRQQPADALQRRRLARAVGADQADELAVADVEVDALDRLDAAVRRRRAARAPAAARFGADVQRSSWRRVMSRRA